MASKKFKENLNNGISSSMNIFLEILKGNFYFNI